MTAEEIRALGRQRDKELSNSAATGSAFLGAAAILQAEALYEIAAQLAELNAALRPRVMRDDIERLITLADHRGFTECQLRFGLDNSARDKFQRAVSEVDSLRDELIKRTTNE